MLVAHRGGGGLAPENTLAAFRSAITEWDADMLEMDVRLTRDGEVVVFHDSTLERTTNGSGLVADHTLAELRALDAGHRFRDPNGNHSYRGRGATIPTLEEVVQACPGVWLNVEVKEAQVTRSTIEVINRLGEQHRVLIAAENERDRRSANGYRGPWGASSRQLKPFWLAHWLPRGGPYTPTADIFQVPEMWKGVRIVSPRFIREAHRRNIPVHVWTVNETEDMRRLLSWGVDGVQTDRPDRLAAVLSDVSGRPPPPKQRGAQASR
jgi:glycerophosphoryl diester phosphodiesterase